METIVIDRLQDGNFKMANGKILTKEQFDRLEALMPETTFIILSYYGSPKRQSNREQINIDFKDAL